MIITKAKIIKAIKTEPRLKAGSWVQHSQLPTAGKCEVCAVGSVLRACKMPNNVADRLANSTIYSAWCGSMAESQDAIETSIANGEWLQALSQYFEALEYNSDDLADRRTRNKVIKFVEDRFPAKIVIPDSEVKEAELVAFDRMLSDLRDNCNGFVSPVDLNKPKFTALQKSKINKAATAFYMARIKEQEDAAASRPATS